MILRRKQIKDDNPDKNPVNILVIADEQVQSFYSDYEEKHRVFDGIDLIISCGDLSPHYLSFIADAAHCNVLYVNGNHHCDKDEEHLGCLSIDGTLSVHKGIRILGLGGSMKYKDCGAPAMYTEEEMVKRVKKLRNTIKKAGGFDILVTHSPAFGINDGTDLPHTGFKVFNELLEEYKPKYFLHGHIHNNYGTYKQKTEHNETLIINAHRRVNFIYTFD
ncbi:metallophosphoesterase family protein [Ruminococcus sp. HUN007]|uniref:metallophosphoesterase family protein n=1 Tax=Ruminococcus sp. HUN007 TaxID=1514668 RepID=UPI0005D13AF6|nr:metallophosphoesterase family protein [Ruminococcus sp. HUN007]